MFEQPAAERVDRLAQYLVVGGQGDPHVVRVGLPPAGRTLNVGEHESSAILQNPDPHARQTYQLFGAEELNWHEIAVKVQETLGIPVRYEPTDIPTFAAGLTAAGASAHFVQHISAVAQDYRDGIFAGVNNLVEVIGGIKPITVEDYVESRPLPVRNQRGPSSMSAKVVGRAETADTSWIFDATGLI